MAWTSKRVMELKKAAAAGETGGSPQNPARQQSPAAKTDTDITRLLDAIERGCLATVKECVASLEGTTTIVQEVDQKGAREDTEQTLDRNMRKDGQLPNDTLATSSSTTSAAEQIATHLRAMSDTAKFCVVRSMLNRLTSGHKDEEALRYRIKGIALPSYLSPVSPEVERKIVEYMTNFPLSVYRGTIHGFMVSFVDFLLALKAPRTQPLVSPSLSREATTSTGDEQAATDGEGMMPAAADGAGTSKDFGFGWELPAKAFLKPGDRESTGSPLSSLAMGTAQERVQSLLTCPPELFRIDWTIPCDVAVRAAFGSKIQRVTDDASYYHSAMGSDLPSVRRWEITPLSPAPADENRTRGSININTSAMKANRQNSAAILCGELLFHGACELLDILEMMLEYPTLRAANIITHALMQAVLRVQRDSGYSQEELLNGFERSQGEPSPHPYIRILRLYRRLMQFFSPLMRCHEEALNASRNFDEDQETTEESTATPAAVNGDGENGDELSPAEDSHRGEVARPKRIIHFVPLRSNTSTVSTPAQGDHADTSITPFYLRLVLLKLGLPDDLYTVTEPFVCWALPSRLYYQLLQLRETVSKSGTMKLLLEEEGEEASL